MLGLHWLETLGSKLLLRLWKEVPSGNMLRGEVSMVTCSYCHANVLALADLGTVEWYDYVTFRCLGEHCGRQSLIKVVDLKHLDPIVYDQMVKDGAIDPRYNVIRPRLAA